MEHLRKSKSNVKAGKIKNPVAKTLDYYHIMRDERGEYIINILPK